MFNVFHKLENPNVGNRSFSPIEEEHNKQSLTSLNLLMIIKAILNRTNTFLVTIQHDENILSGCTTSRAQSVKAGLANLSQMADD